MYKTKVQKICFVGLAMALSLILSYVEFLLPLSSVFPGFRIGLSNIVLVFLLYYVSVRDVYLVGIGRVILSGLLFSGATSILYGVAGLICSITMMSLLFRMRKFTPFGVSAVGGFSFQIGQTLVAWLLLKTSVIFYYLPLLLVMGILTGLLNGGLSILLLKKISMGQPREDNQ